jgi:DNA anti-recombination protein RmuC
MCWRPQGLNNRFDFEEQFSVDTEEGRRRPDVKVTMPGGGSSSSTPSAR